MFIYLQPFGQIKADLAEVLGKKLTEVFGLPCKILPPSDLPINAYHRKRHQWHSATILEKALNVNIPEDAERVLGITEVDLFVEGLNFVFGEADPIHGTAVISVFRLNPEYYLLPPNEKLLRERMVKEAIHELGHTYGLKHCFDPSCVMFFSNTLLDTDRKGPGFCKKCYSALRLER